MAEKYDAIVIGGGPAGLAGAMWLARYRLRVLLIDEEDPRNAATWAVHGYLGLDDPPPDEIRRIGRRQALDAGAEYERGEVTEVEGENGAFELKLATGKRLNARRVLFATGLRDVIPEIPGLHDFYGTSIWHCPDCDGPTITGRNVGVIGWGRSIAAFCMEMLTWTNRLTILTQGKENDMPERSREALNRFDIEVVKDPVVRLEGEGGQVRTAHFASGKTRNYDALFFHIAYGPGSRLPALLGCEANEEGILLVDDDYQTSVPGVFAAGDITHGSKLAIRAASDGTRAAIGIYRSLMPEERRV